MSDPKARSQIGPYYTFSERKKPQMVSNYGSKYLGLVACFRGMRTIFQGNMFVLKFNIDTQKDALFEAVSIHFPSPRIICWVSSNSHHQDDVLQVFRLGNPNSKTLHFAEQRYQHFPLSQKTHRRWFQELADARKATEEAIAREAATADAVREAEVGVDRNAGGSGPKCWVGLP